MVSEFGRTSQTIQRSHTINSSILPVRIVLDTPIPIIQPTFESFQDFTHRELTKIYQKVNPICRSYFLPLIYNHSQGILKRTNCNKFTCDRCRPHLKHQLKGELTRILFEKQLYNHIVITTQGRTYRNKHTYVESYPDMMHAWNNLRKQLTRYAKQTHQKLSYVLLQRAQENGYCHLHILTNIYIPYKKLKEFTNSYNNMGNVTIQGNQNVINYVTNDLLKDHEFYIPPGARHYTTSRDIHIDLEPTPDITDTESNTLKIRLKRYTPVIDQLYTAINEKFGYPPPFEEMLKEYHAISSREQSSQLIGQNQPDYIPSGRYINGRPIHIYHTGSKLADRKESSFLCEQYKKRAPPKNRGGFK